MIQDNKEPQSSPRTAADAHAELQAELADFGGEWQAYTAKYGHDQHTVGEPIRMNPLKRRIHTARGIARIQEHLRNQ